jgi:DNA-binding GntR family transcriptional regulator
MNHSTLGQKTYELLLENILTGKYRPGQRLTYEVVSTDLGVSLTPIKEAFPRLEEQGLLVSVPRRGTFVRQFKKTDVEELYEIREMMEALSIRRACRRAEERDVKALWRIQTRLAGAVERGDTKTCIKTDIQFHMEIARISGNRRLLYLLTHSLFTNLFCISEREESFMSRRAIMLAQHEQMIKRIERRDEDGAERVMREQIRQGAASILSSLRSE